MALGDFIFKFTFTGGGGLGRKACPQMLCAYHCNIVAPHSNFRAYCEQIQDGFVCHCSTGFSLNEIRYMVINFISL